MEVSTADVLEQSSNEDLDSLVKYILEASTVAADRKLTQ